MKEAQNQKNWLETCARSVTGDGSRGELLLRFVKNTVEYYNTLDILIIHKFTGYGTLIRSYVEFLRAKLAYHRRHPEFNGNFDYEDYISLKNVDDPNEGYVMFRYSNKPCIF